MRYIVSVLVFCLVISSGVCQADIIDLGITNMDLPEAQGGYIVSLKTEGVEATLTVPAITKDFDWGTLSLNYGGAPSINEPIVSITYGLPKNAIESWGVDIPLAKFFDVRAGLYMGFEVNEYQNHPEKEWHEAIDYGIAGIVASAKF